MGYDWISKNTGRDDSATFATEPYHARASFAQSQRVPETDDFFSVGVVVGY